TDECGNTTTSLTRLTRKYDVTPPEIVTVEDYTLEGCNAEWPTYLSTSYTDNCDGDGIVMSAHGVDDGTSEDGCYQYRLYTFTATDECGNTTTSLTRLTRKYDVTPPEIVVVEDYMLEGCNADWPEHLTTTWTDNCDEGGELTSDEGVDDGTSEDGCYQYRLYTFTATDECGNTTSSSTRLTRKYDVTPPEIVVVEDYMLEGCNADWPEHLTTTWTDNCDEGGELISQEGQDDGENKNGCIQYRSYKFTATDSCGNTSIIYTRIERRFDETPPEIVTVEDYMLEGCNADWPEHLTTTWTDNCDEGGELTSDNGVDEGMNDEGTIAFRLYTFFVEDECGNTSETLTLVSRQLSEAQEGGSIELCRDYGVFDLYSLLPNGYAPNGNWTLVISPQNTSIEISESGSINVSESQPSGDYEFKYEINASCESIQVHIKILGDVLPCVGCGSVYFDDEENLISTALTPNGDGNNDTFNAGIDQETFRATCITTSIQIFNRWGVKVFESQDYKNNWNGSAPSNSIGSSGTIPSGTYFYVIRYSLKLTSKPQYRTITGHFYAATN
ncbi:gliding motility-associated C-terminal domain-containing protein, partial [Flavobacteriaceae sp. LMIT009]